MKHTYLYPLEDGELWLWRAGRMGGSDLFGDPEVGAPDADWVLNAQVADALGAVRDRLMKRLESRDRICIGRQYMIPGSLCEVAQSRERDADQTVREITAEFWDAAHLDGYPYANTYSRLKKVAGQDGRDDWGTIKNFLVSHRRQRLIPVWM